MEIFGIFELVWKNGGSSVVSAINRWILDFANWACRQITDFDPATALHDVMATIPTWLWGKFGSEEIAESAKAIIQSMFEALIPLLQKFGFFGK